MALKYFSMFSGIGGFELGIEASNIDAKCVGYSEVDKYAESVYKKHFPEHKGFGDATKIDTNEIPDFDLLVGGFPCFTANTLIQTDRGILPIIDVNKGDKVLTHKNRYMPVVNKMVKHYNDIGYKIYFPFFGTNNFIECTDNHPFYTYNDGNPIWKEAKDLKEDDYCFVPINHEYYDKIETNIQNYCFVSINHGLWIKIKKIEKHEIDDLVYNLEVEHDNSYTANGIGVHNCQAFSVAGHRRGFNDTRGTLFFEIARVLRDKRPKYFLLENVKGLLSHDKGKTFQTILEILSDLGYYVKWEVYNSKEFVPQNRERIFLEGYLRDRCGGEVLHQPRKGRETVEGEVKSLMKLNKKPQAQTIYDPDGLACCLSANGGGDGGKTGLYRVNELNLVNPQYGFQRGNIYDAENGLSPALCATDYKDPVKILDKCMPVLTPDRENKRQNGRRMKEDGEPSFTLTATDRHGVSNGVRVRKLTPTECERLQAFPDGWTETGVDGEKISNTQRYKCLGNAVTTKVVTYIINQMFDDEE